MGVDGGIDYNPRRKARRFYSSRERESLQSNKSLLGQTRSRPNNLFKLSSVDKLQRSAQPANGGMGSPGVANMISVIALILRFP